MFYTYSSAAKSVDNNKIIDSNKSGMNYANKCFLFLKGF